MTVVLSLLLASNVLLSSDCSPYRVTAYAASEYPGLTADGSTTTWGALDRGEAIAAGSWNLPTGAYVDVDGLGTYRIADRGRLGPRHIDVLVATRSEALAIGSSVRTVCVVERVSSLESGVWRLAHASKLETPNAKLEERSDD